jgi:hypothetical protein
MDQKWKTTIYLNMSEDVPNMWKVFKHKKWSCKEKSPCMLRLIASGHEWGPTKERCLLFVVSMDQIQTDLILLVQGWPCTTPTYKNKGYSYYIKSGWVELAEKGMKGCS